MAYLAAGHVPGEPGPYRQSIEKGIRYVLAHQQANGLLVSQSSHGPMYCHGISTLMLAEVAGMTADAELAESHARCPGARGQADPVGPGTCPRTATTPAAGGISRRVDDSDISVTGWQLMALAPPRPPAARFPPASIDRAVDYLKRCAVKQGGGFGYQPGGGANNPRTGTGILALEICGEHLTPQAVAGAEYLLKHPPQWSSSYFFYEVYYCPIAMFQMGDKYFLAYNAKLVADPARRTSRRTVAGSPTTATTAPAAATTARPWPCWP